MQGLFRTELFNVKYGFDIGARSVGAMPAPNRAPAHAPKRTDVEVDEASAKTGIKTSKQGLTDARHPVIAWDTNLF